ncbi:MAG: hypothetical protein ACTSQE_10430 [Candidatus Heimdallarchaeaceae archaeon]
MIRLLKSNRGVSNIIATLVIFSVMLSALALAFSQIIPSVERFQSSSNFVAATNTFLSFDNSIKRLMNSPDNTSEVLRYDLSTGVLNVANTRQLNLSLTSQLNTVFTYETLLGELVYKLEGNYEGEGGVVYDFGGPLLLVYSINRTTQMTNIIHQTFSGYKLLKLYYSIFLSIENVKSDVVEVNFLIVHLNTTRTADGRGEYFPIINSEAKIQVKKQSHIIDSYYVGNFSTDLNILAETSSFAQTLNYAYTPSTTFALYVNIININIDFRTV